MINEYYYEKTEQEKTKEAIGADITLLSCISEALKKVRYEDYSLPEACKYYGLDYNYVNQLLASETFHKCKARGNHFLPLADAAKLQPNGYEKAYAEIFDLEDISKVILPKDYKDTLLSILNTLKKRESDTIRMYFGLGNYTRTYGMSEIAQKYETSKKKIRKIKAKAIRKLQDENIRAHLLVGNKQWMKDHAVEGMNKAAETPEGFVKTKEVRLEDIRLNELGLSTRSYNALLKAGKNMLSDIMGMNKADLMRIRNVGETGAGEILNAIKSAKKNVKEINN